MKNSFGQNITSIKAMLKYWRSKSTGVSTYSIALLCGNELLVQYHGETRNPSGIVDEAIRKAISAGKLPKPNATFVTVASYLSITGINFSLESRQVSNKKDV